ncbi:CHAT domain-containing protein [Mangrovivirga sp. M17]|uniref:CHAT domain-containing protein n=1 Tax=Mangrovivirga halotolerans TaxID=2993936 RepID=A0ABT3RU18_9BACT|nr:CHAT domain-containing protein [Mangrovivirga halotolerans]MCX2745098.1 CHAT domain-containing protein [Mangrovivirga halotolerans]
MRHILLFLTLSTITLSNSIAQDSKLDKYLSRIKDEILEGDYDKAQKFNEKLLEKSKKRYDSNNPYLAHHQLNILKLDFYTGQPKNLNQDITKLLELINVIYKNDDPQGPYQILEAAEVFSDYGDILFSDSLLNLAEKKITENDLPRTGSYLSLYRLTKLKNLTTKGQYQEVFSLYNEYNEFFGQRLFKAQSSKAEDLTMVINHYSSWNNYYGLALAKYGEIQKAFSHLTSTASFIRSKKGDETQGYAENKFFTGIIANENGSFDVPDELIVAYHDFKDADDSHFLKMQILRELALAYLYRGNESGFRKYESRYRKEARSYDESSVYNLHHKALNTGRKLTDSELSTVENTLNNILHAPQLPENYPGKIGWYYSLAEVAILRETPSNVENYLKKALDLKKNIYGTESVEYHWSKIDLANFYVDFTAKLKSAGEIYKNSYEKIIKDQSTNQHTKVLNLLNHLATYYEMADEHQLAIQTLEEAKDATDKKFRGVEDDPARAVQLEYMASLQVKLADYDKARINLGKALEILEENKKDTEYGIYYPKALLTKANLKTIEAEYDEAEELIEDVDKLIRKADIIMQSKFKSFSTEAEKAKIYLAIGEYDEALDIIHTQLADTKAKYGEGHFKMIIPNTQKAELEFIYGDYSTAEVFASRARNIALSYYGENTSKAIQPAKILAKLSTAIGDYKSAEELTREVLETQIRYFGEDHIDVASSQAYLALLLNYQNKNEEEIEKLFKSAIATLGAKLGTKNPDFASVSKDQAVYYIRKKRYADAMRLLNHAEAVYEDKIGRRNNVNLASILSLKGDWHYSKKEYSKSEDYYEDARKTLRKIFNEKHPEYVKNTAKLARAEYMQDNTKRAEIYLQEALDNHLVYLTDYFPALSERAKTQYWNTIRDDFEFYHFLISKKDDPKDKELEQAYDYALVTKAILLNSGLKLRNRILNSGDEELIDMFETWRMSKELMAQAVSMSAERQAELGIDINDLSKQTEKLEKQLTSKSVLFLQEEDRNKITSGDVQKSLDGQETAIEMVRIRTFDQYFGDSVIYVCYMLTDKEIKRVNLPRGNYMETKGHSLYKNSIYFGLEDNESYHLYWKSVAKQIPDASKIYFSPDGVYNQINLESLSDENDSYVFDEANIILVSNTKEIYQKRNKKEIKNNNNKAEIIGSPQFYSSNNVSKRTVKSLPGTKKEAEELNTLLSSNGWTTNTLTGAEASEQKIKEIKNPKVFHVATHGFFNEGSGQGPDLQNPLYNPLLRSGLLLSGAGDLLAEHPANYNADNGVLTAFEAMNMDLDNTDLVVLSACETAGGDIKVGEGVYGLQRAFLVAGAETLVMSLFKVDDKVTSEFMITFYKEMLDGKDKREAFYAAKKKVKEDHAAPKYWAPFVMIGM